MPMVPMPAAGAAIRPLSESDAPAIFEILEAARAASRVPIGPRWTADQLASECREQGLVFERPPSDGRAAEVAAFILWRETGAAWEISFLATAPAAQGQGLMNALIEHMKRERPSDRPIWLEVHAENRSARALYEKAGFTQTGERPKYYSDGGSAVLYNYG